MTKITSAANDHVKHARQVRAGRERGLIFVEGTRLAEECVAAGLRLQACFVTTEPDGRIGAVLGRLSCPVFEVTEAILASLADTVHPQGIILIAERPWPALDQVLAGDAALILGLDRVQDPGNVGTLIRTAEAAGATGVLAFAGTADAFSPKALRGAMGSSFRLPVITDVSGIAAIAACRKRGLQAVIATGDGESTHCEHDWRRPTLLILGNEGRGVDADLRKHCDARLRIPLHAPVESLNVAAAGAVLLFEAARQRGGSTQVATSIGK